MKNVERLGKFLLVYFTMAVVVSACMTPHNLGEGLVQASATVEAYTKTVTDLSNRRLISVADAADQLAKLKTASENTDAAWALAHQGDTTGAEGTLATVNQTLDLILAFLTAQQTK